MYELQNHARVSSATFIAQRGPDENRRLQGWDTEIKPGTPVVIAPSSAEIESIVRRSPQDSVHIFSGMHWVPCIVDGLRAVMRHHRRFGILSEPRVFEGPSGIARLIHSWTTEFSLRANISFILAIGAHGPAWFRMAGYTRDRIFPFAYFLPEPTVTEDTPFAMRTDARPTVCFLGRLEKMKGIHLFVEALDHFSTSNKFFVAGRGSFADLLRETDRVRESLTYLGPVKMSHVPYFLANTDVLVLPSITKDDGWGAVVSEALMSGAAVVASHKVGASMCLTTPVRGTIVQNLTGRAVAAAVENIISNGYCSPAHRHARVEWARKHLTQKNGVDYLLRIFDHVFDGEPRPPSFIESL